MNTFTSRAPEDPTRSEEVQVPRSPQSLSLQLDGLNARVHGKDDLSTTTYVETSERGSDSSFDARPTEPKSASTVTDSVSSVPFSLMNDSHHSIPLENSQSSNEIAQTPKTYASTEEQPPVNGNRSIDESHAPIGLEKWSNDTISPLRSPSHASLRSGNGIHVPPRHKRTATGDIKSISSSLVTPNDFETNGVARRRSKSTGSPAHGSRIAQVIMIPSP